MVFLVAEGEIIGRIMLVRAADVNEVNERLDLRENEKVVGSLTDSQLHALTTAGFTVITS